MAGPVVYDLSRLALRLSRSVPSGIDRVDFAWAKEVFERDDAHAIVIGALGPRLVPGNAARVILKTLETHWGEGGEAADDAAFQHVRAWIIGRSDAGSDRAPAGGRARLAWTVLDLLRRSPLGKDGLFPGRAPATAIPHRAFYINASQFPLALPRLCRWLDGRRDLRAAVLVHDMLPISHPEFFPPGEYEQHRRFIDRAARMAEVLVVTSAVNAESLAAYLSHTGLPAPRIEIIAPTVDPIFAQPREHDAELAERPYFVACGTIEPRKNHLLLLNVWRELSRSLGRDTPKLVLVGAHGWENENVVDLLTRSEALRPHVISTTHLGTRGLKRLLDNCRSLLMPTFAEGFGLPIAEAQAAGVPVVASRLSSIEREHAQGGDLELLSPLDGLGWLKTITQRTSYLPTYAAIGAKVVADHRVVCSTGHRSRVMPKLFHSSD